MSFVTKDSGKRVVFDSGFNRDVQEGKPRYDLIPTNILKRLADLYARGAEKYGPDNWHKANSPEEYQRFIASGFRHFEQWRAGETDEDHAMQAVWNIISYEWHMERLAREKADLLDMCPDCQGSGESGLGFTQACATCDGSGGVPKPWEGAEAFARQTNGPMLEPGVRWNPPGLKMTHDPRLDLPRGPIPEELKVEHLLYQTGDSDAPDSILDANGVVVLGLCRRCGLAEGDLGPYCEGEDD